MKITPDNVGNIIQLDPQAEHILIEAVTADLVFFRKETGDRYSSSDHDFAGSILQDEARIAEFHRNVTLGTALNHAEYRAVSTLSRSNLTHEQREDAISVLKSVESMKQHMAKRIKQRDQWNTGKPHHSLSLLISQASRKTHDQQSQPNHSSQILFGAER